MNENKVKTKQTKIMKFIIGAVIFCLVMAGGYYIAKFREKSIDKEPIITKNKKEKFETIASSIEVKSNGATIKIEE